MRKTVRFSLFETALIVAFAMLVSAVAIRETRDVGPSLTDDNLEAALAAKYGNSRVSQGIEEWIVRDFFNDARGGIFADIGAWEPVRWSNTYRLEHDLGWRGLAVDALEELAPSYRQIRPNTRFVSAFVGDRNDGTATLHVPETLTAVASASEGFVHHFSEKTSPRSVPRRTLDSLLEEAGLSSVDFLSMDIELSEPAALSGFSVNRFKPKLVCIEAHGETRQAILNFFASHGYVVVGKYLPHDRVNLYFMPASSS